MNHPPLLLLTLTSVIAIHSTDHTIKKHLWYGERKSKTYRKLSNLHQVAPRVQMSQGLNV